MPNMGVPILTFSRKNLYTATSTVGHLSGTEALRPVLASNPVNITSADLRRPSNVSQMSGIENGSATGVAGLLDSLEGHVPHMICTLDPNLLPLTNNGPLDHEPPDPPQIVDLDLSHVKIATSVRLILLIPPPTTKGPMITRKSGG
jgi:hypothetical protein